MGLYMKQLMKQTNSESTPTIFEIYASQIWNYSSFAEDEKRWHSSGYHIAKNQLTIDDAIEDACEMLGSIVPDKVNITLSLEEWNTNYIDNPKMIAAMTKEIYSQLKESGRYAFKEEPNWNSKVTDYINREFENSLNRFL